MKVYVTISIDEKLLRLVDQKRGDVPRSRYIANALRAFLEGSGGGGG